MTSTPMVTGSLILERGHLVAVAEQSARLLGIERSKHDQFELTFNEMHPDGIVTVNTSTDDRLVGEHALLLLDGDVVTVPGIGSKLIGAITCIREGRYQIRLEEKFVPAVVLDVDMSAPPL